jgi:peroxiredoxin
MKRQTLALFATVLISAVAAYTGYYVSQESTTEMVNEITPIVTSSGRDQVIGSTRPEFTLSDVAGELRNINEWDGKVLAINFWATWCPPCIKEIPEFIEIQHKYQKQGLQFIGIALQRPEEVTEFIKEYGINYPILAGEMEVIKIAESYGNDIGALPYTVIVDRKGLIHFIKRGPLDGESAEAIISKLL